VEDREVVLTVEDNGAGLSPKMPGTNGGTGIEGMRRRAESLGGSVQLSSQPGHGCRVTIHLPTRHGAFSKPSL
jgi:signal transduction histidine kinase